MNLTLICYRPNHDDVCMGCHMGSSDSEIDITYSTNSELIVDTWAGHICEEHFYDQDYSSWEYTLLLNGKPAFGGYTLNLQSIALTKAKLLINNRNEEIKKENEERRRAEFEQRVNEELAEFERLKEKFKEIK